MQKKLILFTLIFLLCIINITSNKIQADENVDKNINTLCNTNDIFNLPTTKKCNISTNATNKKPKIIGATNKKIQYGSTLNLKDGIIAISANGKNITSKMTIKGKVNTKKLGKYKITYSIKDNNIKISKTITIKVINNKKPEISGVENLNLQISDKNIETKIKTALSSVTAQSATGKNLTENIQISGKYNTSQANTYKLTFSVTDPLNNKTATKSMKIIIKDDSTPIISNVSDKTIFYSGDLTESEKLELIRNTALENITIKNNDDILPSSNIKLDITNLLNDEYAITYYYLHSNDKIVTKQVLFYLVKESIEDIYSIKFEDIQNVSSTEFKDIQNIISTESNNTESTTSTEFIIIRDPDSIKDTIIEIPNTTEIIATTEIFEDIFSSETMATTEIFEDIFSSETMATTEILEDTFSSETIATTEILEDNFSSEIMATTEILEDTFSSETTTTTEILEDTFSSETTITTEFFEDIFSSKI